MKEVILKFFVKLTQIMKGSRELEISNVKVRKFNTIIIVINFHHQQAKVILKINIRNEIFENEKIFFLFSRTI